MNSTTFDAPVLLRDMFQAAVAAAAPSVCLPPYLPTRPTGRVVVVGAGKAAASMAAVVEACWPGPLEGLVVTRYGHGTPTRYIQVVEAGHPMPDQAGADAARKILDMVQGLGPDDLVLALISGGGSALLALPAPGLTFEDKRIVNKALLRSGATIAEMNCVRKQLSAIKGGRLAMAAAPARVVSLIVSDVPGDDPAIVASGPTVPDATTRADALAIIRKYGIDAPRPIVDFLQRQGAETPKPDDPRFARLDNRVIATAQGSLEAAAEIARRAGIMPVILGNAIEGEARDVALVHAAIARQCAGYGQPAAAPCVLISGGETSVTVRGSGKGGRNAEFLLALAIALDGHPAIHAIACDTDGIDGTEDNAGALLGPDSLARAAALGIDAKALLANNDGYGFFETLGDLLITGPTRTNVNDFRAIAIMPVPG